MSTDKVYILLIENHEKWNLARDSIEKEAYLDQDKVERAAGIAAIKGYKVSIEEIPFVDG